MINQNFVSSSKEKEKEKKKRKRSRRRKRNGTHALGFNESEERRRIPRLCGGASDRDSRASGKRTRNETKGRREKVRKGWRVLHAGLIYAHRPATSDKSLTPRHYLFELARARTFLLKVPVKMIPPR